MAAVILLWIIDLNRSTGPKGLGIVYSFVLSLSFRLGFEESLRLLKIRTVLVQYESQGIVFIQIRDLIIANSMSGPGFSRIDHCVLCPRKIRGDPFYMCKNPWHLPNTPV